MDKLSGLASKLGGKGGQQSSGSGSHSGGSSGGSSGQEDYLDKGLDAVEKKVGGDKVDTDKLRSTNEKFTDAARNQFESKTGKHVPEKFSN